MSNSKLVTSGSDANRNKDQKDLRAELIRNLFSAGVGSEQISELMNMPVDAVSEYIK